MRLLLALVLLLAGCATTQHDPSLPPVRVRVEGCLSPHLAWADEALAALAAVGPTWTRVDAGEDVVLRCEDLSAECQCIGNTVLGGRVARIDESRAAGKLELVNAIEHELLHSVGLLHVCHAPAEDAHCSSVGYGDAVMNPRQAAFPLTTPTDLDLAEWNRVHGGH